MDGRVTENVAGYISFSYVDVANNEFVELGGAGWPTPDEVFRVWSGLPTLRGDSNYIADRLDADGDIIGTKSVGAHTIEAALGKPIGELIESGREKNRNDRQRILEAGEKR